MNVAFFLPRESDLARLAGLDPDRDAPEFRRGERAWILQTFLRLRAAGFASELVDRVPAAGLVVYHAKHDRDVRRGVPPGGRPVLVGARADNRQSLSAEFELLQNGRFADGRSRHAVPHWPQPGLRPRDPERGERLSRLAYKGFLDNLHPDFAGERWRSFLAARGIEWVVDAERYAGVAIDRAALAWSDFHDIDALVAIRRRERKTDFSKPATKLVNAWLAGVPALLGPEYAFRELRRGDLDYLEIGSLAEAEAAVDRLASEPGLYRAMVDNGRRRAPEVDVAAVTAAWRRLLGETLPRLAREPGRERRRAWPLAARRAGRWLARSASLRPAR
ncbi:MAG: hypothetical protein U0X73_08735 [Thermoanaerobaculia bacterium]